MELSESLRQKIANYKPSAQVWSTLNNARVLLISAISGGGKDTIKHRLLDTGQYHHIISFTTRSPRENHGTLEQDGVDYHFIDLAAADRMLSEGIYIEADIYVGNVYGTAIPDVIEAHEAGKIATTDLTIEGAIHYLRKAPNVKSVFLLPPTYEIWMQRLKNRNGGEHLQDMRLRLREAVDEIECALQSDSTYIVVNDNLEDSIKLIDAIAHGEPVEPHYHKAMEIAQHLLDRLREELARVG